ncbi:MAG TPA: methyltransferase domain-containing protein [Roseiflexaceae bacterium]|nr:methyltransferase domain-containing protein [Roseiflexaceae bacterium]
MQQDELQRWFNTVRDVLETAYVAADEPWRQSGMSGPYERWAALRRPVADAIDRNGTFLDIGCANGYLLECCLAWTAERGIEIEPFGVDISERLAGLARERLPLYADNLMVANAFEWIPPRRFDFVRTELVYVPGEYERQYIDHLREHYLAPGGRLLIANYAEQHPDPASGLLPGSHPTHLLHERLAELGVQAIGYRDGYDVVKGRHVRVAIVPALA